MALFQPFKLQSAPKGRESFRDKGKMAHRAQVTCQYYITSLAAPISLFPCSLQSGPVLYVKLWRSHCPQGTLF